MYKKKVLHIVEDLKVGGLEKVIATIALQLDRAEYDVAVWCLARGGAIADELMGGGVPVRDFQMESYHKPWKIVTLGRAMSRERIDILHTHGYFGSTFGRLAGITARVPIIISHVHSSYSEYKKRNILIEKVLSYFTDKIVCVSRSVQRFVVDVEKISQDKTRVVYNGCNPGEACNGFVDEEEDGVFSAIGKQNLVIIVVASLTENKGHGVLLNAFKVVSDKVHNAKLVIVGDGPLRTGLISSARMMDIESQVMFAGERRDVARLLKRADLFVLPSVQREGLGVALIEAMAAGLPVIGSRLGGIPEVIEDNVNGFLVTPGDPNELARRMMTLLEDESMREEMGEAGRRIYERRFTTARMVHNIESLYDELLKRRMA